MTPIFRLEQFPHVCRLCLKASNSQPLHREVMVPLSATDPVLDGGSIRDFITAITFVISEDKHDLLPSMVCLPCLELLRFFAKYRSKITTIHLLMNSLVELKRSNSVPLVDLFRSKSDLVRMVIKDLDLCTVDDYSVEDLLDEFPQYKHSAKDLLEDVNPKSDVIYAEECTPDELNELTKDCPILLETDSSDDYPIFKQLKPPIKSKYGGRKLETPLECQKCNFKTYYKRNLQTHQQKHVKREIRRYPCKDPGCTEVFNTIRMYQRHSSVAHKSFVCDICGLRCSSKNSLKSHMDRHLNKFEHVCPYCQRGHNTKGDLRNHIKFAHSDDCTFPCKICGLIFRRKTILNKHILSHSDTLNVACKLCDKKFKRNHSLIQHVKIVHDMIRLPCSYCSNAYQTTYKLKEHIESVHGVQTRFVCDVCVQVFDSQEKLDSHKARHDDPKELECATCLVVFPSADRFDNHMCISYRDDYMCCGRDLRYHYFYNKHMLIKHGVRVNVRVKPIPGLLMGQMRAKRKRIETCPKCEQIFATRTQKKQHMEICAGSEGDGTAQIVPAIAVASSNVDLVGSVATVENG
ncbi:zinc finger and BTB domain-containing protein 24-like [Ochlerotatus camptorhynchus]|uniref:zinc finger and BTB domain-containing protein 24-like n=1 Tax=Ochlerotatus camptorhynchus TaxID=644619 RepID=UPI0031E2F99E